MSAQISIKRAQLNKQFGTFTCVPSLSHLKAPAVPKGTFDMHITLKTLETFPTVSGGGLGLFTGIRDGRTYGVVVIDIDAQSDTRDANGKRTAEGKRVKLIKNELMRIFPECSITCRTLTPSGGYHFYLVCDRELANRSADSSIYFIDEDEDGFERLTPLSIDIRGQKGYIQIAPSPYPDPGNAADKAWKKKYTGKKYIEEVPLDEDHIQPMSDELYDFINGRKSLKKYWSNDDRCDRLLIWEQVETTPTESANNNNELEQPTESTDDESEAKKYGYIRDVELFKEMLNCLDERNLETRQNWIETMWTLIHVFADSFGGKVCYEDFCFHFNDRCKLFKGYDKANNIAKIREGWDHVHDKMRRYPALKEMLIKNMGDELTYNKWCYEMRDKGLMIFKQRELDIKDYGDLAQIGKDTPREVCVKFIHDNIRYVTDRGETKVYTRNLIRGISPLPGMKIIYDDQIDRYYEWSLVDFKALLFQLSHQSTGIIRKTPKGKESKAANAHIMMNELLLDCDIRRPITYKIAKFSPRALDKNNEVFEKVPKAFGEFSYAPDFRARVKYTREEALNHKGCQLLLNHVKEVLVNGSEEGYKYMLGVQAHMLQRPDVKVSVMCIFRDELRGGSGKSLYASLLGYGIFGSLFQQYSTLDEYQEKHETDKTEKCFIWIDELASNGVIDKAKLKNAITGSDSAVNGKHKTIKRAENFNCIMAATNETAPIPIDPGQERRYAVFDVSKEERSAEYFENLRNLPQDALDAYFSYLMSIDIDKETNFVIGKGFGTDATISQQATLVCSTDKLFIDFILGEFRSQSTTCLTKFVNNNPVSLDFHTKSLYDEYVRHTEENGQMPVKELKFKETLKSFGEQSKITVGPTQRLGMKLSVDRIITVMRKRLGNKLYDYLTKLGEEEPQKQSTNNANSDNIIDDPTTRLEYTDDWLNDDLGF